MVSSQELMIAAARRGDRRALSRLLEESAVMLRHRITRKIDRAFQSLIAVEDIPQVTFLEAFLLVHAFETTAPGSFLAWLTRIAENNLRDAVRELTAEKRPDPKRRASAHGQESAIALLGYMVATTRTPSGKLALAEARRWLEDAVRRLPADYRRVVELYDLQQRSVSETADKLGRSTGAIFMLRARAHDRLWELLPSASEILSDSA